MRTSKRIAQIPPYLFAAISKKIAEKRAKGIDVISLAIGDPDLPTPQHVVDRLCDAARDQSNHGYPETDGLPALRQAVAQWYEHRFDITLDPNKEVLPLIGSKEGIAHIGLALIDSGDVALVPDPGYPVYALGTVFAGGEVYPLPLREDNCFLPDLENIPPVVLQRAKVLWLNYPNNPTAATAELDFFERVVAFAKRHDLVVCHDGPYSDVAFDGYRPPSFLQVKGAKDIGLEFNSLSKTYNMAGWRIGMVVGNSTLVSALTQIKSNLDSGIFQAVQLAAIEALSGPQDAVEEHNRVYQRRRDRLVAVLNQLGLHVTPPKASLYIWAKIPPGYDSIGFASRMLDEASVVVTPGIGYGQNGEGYIRLSLTVPDHRLEQAIERLSHWRAAW